MAGATFKDSFKSVGFLKECTEYLAARGLDYHEVLAVNCVTESIGVGVRSSGEFEEVLMQGWAFRVKDRFGEIMEGCFLVRPMWPDEKMYMRISGAKDGEKKYKEYKKPKFRQVGNWGINWLSTAAECKASSTLFIHEKFCCSYLTLKHLKAPSIGLSGCFNWCEDGAMRPELRDVLVNMPPGASVYLCLDGDVATNPTVNRAARSFKGYMDELRPDIKVILPVVPEGFGGWDDWVVAQGGVDVSGHWLQELNSQHIDVTSFLTTDVLITLYGLASRPDKDGNLFILHTTDNYIKLFSQNPLWDDYILNIDGMLYHKELPGDQLEYEDLSRKFEIWLSTCVFSGRESEKVSSDKCLKAVKEVLARPDRRFSLPHYWIEKLGAPCSDEEAVKVVEKLITDGIRVTGPMTQEETVATLLRVYRDMVGMWSFDRLWKPQWMLAIIGPSNAGKSDFAHSALRYFEEVGFLTPVGKLHQSGDKAKPEEMARVLMSILVGVVDEYNPSDRTAKPYEDQLISTVSDRTIVLRRMRENNAKAALRAASIFLTTTDRNRQYLRSGKGEGAERRAITLEIEGFKDFEGKLSSDREVVQNCSKMLLRWGLEAYRRGWPGSATEYSMKYASEYLAGNDVLRNVSRGLVFQGMEDLISRGHALYRKHTEDYRFNISQLTFICVADGKVSQGEQKQLRNAAVEAGATPIRQGKVNSLKPGGRETMSNNILSVKDWEVWVEEFMRIIDRG